MYQQKLCLGIGSYGVPEENQPRLFKDAGFEYYFFDYDGSRENAIKIANAGKAAGIELQSVHGPYKIMADIWKDCNEGELAVKELIECLEVCSEIGAPIMISHVYIGFDTNEKPTELGLKRLDKVVEFGTKRGVKIAFENTEGEEFLATVMEHFKGNSSVGFCWDSGHEQCYNFSKNMLALYGDRLLCTHLNDNLGISDFGGHTFWTDDLHLLPFDGIIDWKNAADRLNAVGYNGILTFELNRNGKAGRHDNDNYQNITPEQYIAEAYNRACRFAFMKQKSAKN